MGGYAMICAECGKPFEPKTTKGRPRTKCYECRPYRPNQHGTRERRPVPPPKPQTVADVKADPHCPFCGSYPAPSSEHFPFCSPRHRQQFAEKVARAQERQRIRRESNPRGPYRGTHIKKVAA